MSFLFDLPALFFIGMALYYVGKKLDIDRLAKITIGLLIVLCFISGSILLYFNIFNIPPRLGGYTEGSKFMFAWPVEIGPWFCIEKIPCTVVVAIFLLYPVAIYSGYASAILLSKRRRNPTIKESKSYEDVKSRSRIDKTIKFSIVRYPDTQNNIANLKEAVEESVKKLGGMKKFVHPGDSVLIKANICGGNPNNLATYTSQEVVGYVADMIREVASIPETKVKVCDADMVWTKFWEIAKSAYWDTWAKEKNVELVNLSESELAYFDFGEGTVFKHNEKPNKEIISKEMLDADVIIDIPKMKTHLFTGVTLGMKNMYGTLPEMDKARYHKKGIHEVIYRINYAFTPTLTIIDGSIGGEAIGPLSARSVPFNTIIASNNVVVADVVASKLIGYEDPFEEIDYLKLTKEIELNRPAKDRKLLPDIPKELDKPISVLRDTRQLPKNSKDGEWEKADSGITKKYNNLVDSLLVIPFIDTFFNIIADFVLFDLSRVPLLNHLQYFILQFLYSAPRYWAEKEDDTPANRQRKIINLAIFTIFAAASLFLFVNKGYYDVSKSNWNLSQWIILGLAVAILFGAWFARRMKTEHLVALILSSIIMAYFVESYGPYAKWWVYNLEDLSYIPVIPLFSMLIPSTLALFLVPIFIISIIGFSYFLSRILSYVNLNASDELRFLPYLAVITVLPLLLYYGDYIPPKHDAAIATQYIIITYIIFASLGIYFNAEQNLNWNLSLVIVAVALGGLMEYLGALPTGTITGEKEIMHGFWGYPNITGPFIDPLKELPFNEPLKELPFNGLPLFISFTWVMNTWAVCGISLLLGRILEINLNLSEAFADSAEDFDEDDTKAWIRKGNYQASQGKYKEAVESFDNALKIDSQLAEAWHGKGGVFACQGKFSESLNAYDKALKIDPNHADAWYHKACVLQNLCRNSEKLQACKELTDLHEKACKPYDVAIQLNPGNIDAHADKALALQQQGRFKESMEAYNKAIRDIRTSKMNPANKATKRAQIWYLRGFANIDLADIGYYSNGGYEDAIKCFNRVIKLGLWKYYIDEIWLASAWWGKGYALAKTGKYEEALDAFDKLNVYHDKAALAWSDKGDILINQGDYKKALKAYEKAIELYPKFSANIPMERIWKGEEDAVSKLTALAWNGKGDALFILGRQYEAHKAYIKSIDKLDKLTQGNRKDADAWAAKGYVLSKIGIYSEALEAYKKAIEYAPSYQPLAKKEALSAVKDTILAKMGYYNRTLISTFKVQGMLNEVQDDYGIPVDINLRYAEAWPLKVLTLHMLWGHDD